jgi:hypothetical protein
MYGHLTLESTKEALAAAWNGEVLPDLLRGRTALPGWAQSAEIAVRQHSQIRGADVLDVVTIRNGRPVPTSVLGTFDPEAEIQVRHQDGRSWNVTVQQSEIPARKVSCNGVPESGVSWLASEVTDAAHWHS